MQYGPAAALTIEPMSPGEPTVTLGWGSLSPPRLGSRQEAPRDLAGYAGVSNQKRQGGKEKEAVLEVTLLPTTPRNPRRSPRVSASAADRDKDRHRERDRDQEAVASASTPRAEAALRGEAQKTSTHKKASSPRAQDCQSKLLLSLETKSAGAPNPSSFPMLK